MRPARGSGHPPDCSVQASCQQCSAHGILHCSFMPHPPPPLPFCPISSTSGSCWAKLHDGLIVHTHTGHNSSCSCMHLSHRAVLGICQHRCILSHPHPPAVLRMLQQVHLAGPARPPKHASELATILEFLHRLHSAEGLCFLLYCTGTSNPVDKRCIISGHAGWIRLQSRCISYAALQGAHGGIRNPRQHTISSRADETCMHPFNKTLPHRHKTFGLLAGSL